MAIFVDSPSALATRIGGGQGVKFERGPDGNEYFAILGPSVHLIRTMRYLAQAQAEYQLIPRGAGRHQAAAIGALIGEMQAAMQRSSVRTAEFAEQRAATILEQRIVRPATPSPHRLKDAITANPILVPQPWYGAVGIGEIGSLDRHPYWKAIEFGSTHLVGREPSGWFIDSGGDRWAPNPGRFRQDAIFRPGQGPRMRVQNPIEGKAFLSQATIDAMAFRFRLWRGVEAQSVARMRLIRAARMQPRALRGIARRAPVSSFVNRIR